MTETLAASPPQAITAIVVVSVDELERIVDAAVTRAMGAPTTSDAGEWLTAAGAAKLLDVHRRTIGKLAQNGELPCSRIGKLLRFRRCDLITFLESQAR